MPKSLLNLSLIKFSLLRWGVHFSEKNALEIYDKEG